MVKRRTLKANLKQYQEQVKALEQRIDALTKRIQKLSQFNVQEIENPIVELKSEMLLDEMAIENMPMEYVKEIVAKKFLETDDEDRRWQPNLLDCIKFEIENTPCHPNPRMRRVVAYLTAVNKNIERRTAIVI